MSMLGELMETILYVEDMNAQVSFYRDQLGLSVKEPQGLDDYHDVFWLELDTGACTLVLHGGGKRRLGEDAPKIVFRVTVIAAARADLLRKGVKLGEVRSPAPSVQVCDGLDPEGNKFSLETRAT